jgi:hypothetical protein
MSDGSVKDMVALLQVIADKRVTDERFAAMFERLAEQMKNVTDVLNEASAALAEVSDATSKKAEAKDEAREAEAMGKALAAALIPALRAMPQPVIKVDAPAPTAAAPWRTLSVKTPKGDTYTVTRA